MITEYIAKPNLNNNIGLKTFSLETDAIKYLEEYTGYEMSFEKNKKTGCLLYTSPSPRDTG